MGRRKIEIKPIKDDRNRSVTFLKRKGGLFKKAHELSVLCSVDVAVIIFGNNNKKLYQYSSGDIQEIISRHSYQYDMPHESKGPNDFKGKKDVGDDDDDDDIPIEQERANSHSSNDHALPHHLHGHPGLPHMANRHTASASPPIASKAVIGAPGSYSIPGRVGTPPTTLTRPSSRNAMQRRNSSNLVPSNAYPSSQAPTQNGAYAYMSQQSVYNPQGQPVVPMQSNINQIPGYTYHPQQQPQTEAQAQAQAYITDTSRRQSMPPTFAPERPMPSSENSPPHTVEDASATAVEKRAPAKSRSMYTPIGPSDSMLAQHFGFGQEPSRSHSVDVGAIQRKTAAASAASAAHAPVKSEDRHDYSPKSVPAPPPPPPSAALPTEVIQPHPISRTNSIEGAKPGVRPRLKVRIPSEHSDAGSATEESSPRASSGTTGVHSAKGASEGTHGIHLPPPSPSVSALLSAGANGGPSNPFARPPPTSSAPEQTPMSALPSRFTESMLPSPSSFYPDNWGVPFPQSRGSNGDNMLPSPLNFQTPVGGSTSSQPIFKDAESNKRKSPEPDNSEGSVAKRRKS